MAAQIRVTDAQFSVLEALWDQGPQTIRQITAKLYPAQSNSDYATVQKLLEQLEEKQCVDRDRSRMAHVFSAKIERSDLIDAQLEDLAERLCGGSLTPVLMRLVEANKLSQKDRDVLRGMLDEAKQSASKSRRRRR